MVGLAWPPGLRPICCVVAARMKVIAQLRGAFMLVEGIETRIWLAKAVDKRYNIPLDTS